MIYTADSFWYNEVPESIRISKSSMAEDVANHIKTEFDTKFNVKMCWHRSESAYSVEFADPRYETLFRIKYSEYVRD